MTSWFDEWCEAVKAAKTEPRILPFPTQAVRNTPHRKALPDVYERNVGEQCDVGYLKAHLGRSEAIVDAPVASCGPTLTNRGIPYTRWYVSDVIPGQKDGE